MELLPDGGYVPVGGTVTVPVLNGLALREAISEILPSESGLTRDEIWAALPDDLKVNELRFRSVLESEADRLWRKAKKPGNSGTIFTYRRLVVNV